tara:strand:+ start:332 stop:1192 length:861 start_codon:yes stop_codon:yes gene_type:complete
MVTLQGEFIAGLVFLGLSVILFIVAKYTKDFLTPYNDTEELGKKQNTAVGISFSGYLFAVIIVLLGALLGPSRGLFADISNFVGYAILGIALLNLSRIINDKILLRKFCNIKELIDDQNAGAGCIEFGSYLASGLVVAGSIHGQGGGVHTALAFFALSQAVLIIFAFLYNLITPFDLHDEIEHDNVAAGVAFGGTLVALGIILLKGVVGDFISWQYNLTNFAISVASSMIFLPIIRILLDKILIPKINLSLEIAKKNNLAIGILEMTVAISFAVILYFSIDFDIPL